MSVLIRIIEVIFSLTLLVFVHELGHFLAAKIFKIRVEKFYIFFDIGKFALLRFKPKGSDTEYGIGWLPLGGYCKISGMVDESMDKEQMKQPPKPYEFRSHPVWQRFIVMFAGVFNNFILAIILYAAVFSNWGNEYIKNSDASYGIATNSLSYEMGFRDGDKVIGFDGKSVANFDDLQVEMAREQAKTATVVRGGDTLTLDIDSKYLPAVLNTPGMFDLAFPFVIGSVPDTSLNVGAGLKPGDKFVAVDGKPMYLVQTIRKELLNYKDSSILATVMRGDSALVVPLRVDTAGKINVLLDTDLHKMFNVTQEHYNFFQAIPVGAAHAWKTCTNYFKELGLIFTPKTQAYKSVGSFIRIGSVFPATWDWHAFWLLTAWLSIMLAALNIIPIPGLDGGHILFLLVEMVTGKKPSDKFLEIAETIGLILLILLMILAFGNDIRSLFH